MRRANWNEALKGDAPAGSPQGLNGQPVPLGLSNLASLPAPGTTGIYFLHYAGEVVYVGQGTNIRARIGTHIAEGLKVFDAVSFIPCPRGDLLSRESAFIRRLVPRYNDCAVARRAKRPDTAAAWLAANRR